MRVEAGAKVTGSGAVRGPFFDMPEGTDAAIGSPARAMFALTGDKEWLSPQAQECEALLPLLRRYGMEWVAKASRLHATKGRGILLSEDGAVCIPVVILGPRYANPHTIQPSTIITPTAEEGELAMAAAQQWFRGWRLVSMQP